MTDHGVIHPIYILKLPGVRLVPYSEIGDADSMINVDFLREGSKNLIYIHEEVFWLKECITVGTSLAVFLIVWRIVNLRT